MVTTKDATYPKATTSPPCSLTTELLQPGQSLSSNASESGRCRSRWECSRRGMFSASMVVRVLINAVTPSRPRSWPSSPSLAFRLQESPPALNKSRLRSKHGSKKTMVRYYASWSYQITPWIFFQPPIMTPPSRNLPAALSLPPSRGFSPPTPFSSSTLSTTSRAFAISSTVPLEK